MPITVTSVFVAETGAIDEKGVRRYTREYLVEASDVNATTAQVDAVVPAWGALHPDDPIARVKSASVKQRKEDLCFWDCAVEYDTAQDVTDKGTVSPGGAGLPATPGSNSQQTLPTARPWVFKWGARHRTRHLNEDRGDPVLQVVNAAGQYLDGGLEVPVVNPTVTITGFKAIDPGDELFFQGELDYAKIRDYVDTVNDASFLAWQAGWARCTDYGLTTQHEHGVFFWQFDITIEFQRGGWNPFKALNAGTFVKASSIDKSVRPVVDAKGNPVTHPVPLSADGLTWLNPANPLDVPNYLEFTVYAATDFSKIVNG